MDIDFSEILGRALKYIMEGLAVGLACYFIKLKMDEIIIIAITASVTLAILDMYTPQISQSARMGIGLGIGSQFAGLKIIGGSGLLR
jgi:hypothetical protein